MLAKLPLEAITLVLKDLKGYFTFATVHGEYVVVRKEDFAQLQAAAAEKQLVLPPAEPEVPAAPIDLADHGFEEFDPVADPAMPEPTVSAEPIVGGFDDLAIDSGSASVPGKKVSFEPLRGDLPPELQD
ncbi:hypothetical protein CL628_02165 [bacterium]|nr:hypothetical protein [bacterium]